MSFGSSCKITANVSGLCAARIFKKNEQFKALRRVAQNPCYKHTTKEMKANELRIGNLICPYLKNEGEIAKVLIINGQEEAKYDNLYLECEESFEWTEFDKCSGVIITEEILLKFGFENGIDEMTFCDNLFCIYWRKFENHFEINGEKYFINEVHKFQNLYFALTQTELTLS